MISVIIVNYNSNNYIIKLLHSILQYESDYNFVTEVIIVNNGTQKLSSTDLAFFCLPIKILECENNGFGHANNIGASASTGDVLFFINPDTYFIMPIFKSISEKMQGGDITVIGIRQYSENMKKGHSFGFYPEHLFRFFERFFNDIWPFPNMLPCTYFSGASFFIKKDRFWTINGFDERFFMYYEDVDLFKRLKLKKNEKIFMKKLGIVHLESYSQKSGKGKKSKINQNINSLTFYKTKYGLEKNIFISIRIKYLIHSLLMIF